MTEIPLRFKRVAEAFDDVARARLCESSGSEHWPDKYSFDLSDLVESFIESESKGERDDNWEVDFENETNRSDQHKDYCSDLESLETLRGLLGGGGEFDEVKESIREEAERAFSVAGYGSSPEFKRRLMTWLRERGYDAGLCKSKWERKGRVPSGSYEYVDVNVAETRYIIEVFLAGEFQIARSAVSYTSLLDSFPTIFVGKVDDLKQVVRLMCTEMKGSLKSVDMHVPPWRRHVYMQAKWFGFYRRTTNEVVEKKVFDEVSGKKRWVGFGPLHGLSDYCREGFGRKIGEKIGKLAMQFNG